VNFEKEDANCEKPVVTSEQGLWVHAVTRSTNRQLWLSGIFEN